MADTYDPLVIEEKWQKKWEQDKLYKTPEKVNPKKKLYVLPQLPYPSGSRLHVGHAEVYTACDIYARAKRMQGYDVLQVIGWDAFGLPAENYAIKNNIHPKITTNEAIDNFRYQIKRMGISVDWDREVGSHNPDYYKWTQWFFLLMYHQGLAYRKKQAVNWCDGCKTVLANDQVVTKKIQNSKFKIQNEGKNNNALESQEIEINVCERCDTEIIQKDMEQWFFKITEYADRLYEDLDKVDWPKETVIRQRNWIGKSEGAEVEWKVLPAGQAGESGKWKGSFKTFTTRPDTLYGVTFLVIAPEHPILDELKADISNWNEVETYINETRKKTELDRQTEKIKTGVQLKGLSVSHPLTKKNIPVFIADYVLYGYGTGIVMGVPAHDERDLDFAKKFGLEIKPVINPKYAEYLIIEKSLPGDKVNKLSNFGVVAIQKSDPQWGNFYKVRVSLENEPKLLKFLEENLLPTSEDGGAWYADSMGTSYNVVFPGITFSVRHEEEFKKFYEYGKKLGIPSEQLDVNYSPVCYSGEGLLINSKDWNSWETPADINKVVEWLEGKGLAVRKTTFKLRDWSISRQRFWGAPIPMVYKPESEVNAELVEEYQSKPEKVVVLHAWGSSPKEHFHPWLEDQLKIEDVAVTTPELPDTWNPSSNKWLEVGLEEVGKDSKKTVIVGRSLSCWTVLQLAEKKKIRKVVLVAPSLPNEEYFKQLEESQLKEKDINLIKKFLSAKIDFKAIQENIGELVVYLSTNDPYIPLEASERFVKANFPFARIVRVRNAGHFDSKSGYGQFPKLVEEVLRPVHLRLKPLQVEDLPVILPDDVDFIPTGRSPLTYSKDFQTGVEGKFGKDWQREVDTLDTFMCSSWYYFRYIDPHNQEAFASAEALKNWMPVDFYIGGPEHTTGHLLYSRFFTKVLYDAGYIDFDEPFIVHRHQGLILGEDNRKMSKRWGNVINPTEVMDRHGADALRLYEMFMGPLEATKAWSTKGEQGIYRFLQRIWRIYPKVKTDYLSEEQEIFIHKLIKEVTQGLESLAFNTTIAKFMEFINFLTQERSVNQQVWERFLILIAPFAPHLAEELWLILREKDSNSIHQQSWPTFDEIKTKDEFLTIAVQVNGKLRATLQLSREDSLSKDLVEKAALSEEKLKQYISNKSKKTIFVPGKLINFVV